MSATAQVSTRPERESALQRWARETLLRASRAPLVRVIEYWRGDAAAVRAALVAVVDLQTLLDHAGLSDVAVDAATGRLAIIRKALERFT
jgi:hypothetical protein